MTKKPLSIHDVELLSQYGLRSAELPKALHLSFAPGEYISHAGEVLRYLYFVVSGKAKVLLNLSDGKQLLLAYFISQGIIGDIELMTNGQNNQATLATLQAVTQFECIALPMEEYRTTLKNNNVFINYIGKELAQKLIGRSINGAITTLQPLEARLCAYIYQTAMNGEFSEALTEVAVMVGASYRHLLRSFNQLCNSGILAKKGRAYRIVDRQALVSMAGDLYVLK